MTNTQIILPHVSSSIRFNRVLSPTHTRFPSSVPLHQAPAPNCLDTTDPVCSPLRKQPPHLQSLLKAYHAGKIDFSSPPEIQILGTLCLQLKSKLHPVRVSKTRPWISPVGLPPWHNPTQIPTPRLTTVSTNHNTSLLLFSPSTKLILSIMNPDESWKAAFTSFLALKPPVTNFPAST